MEKVQYKFRLSSPAAFLAKAKKAGIRFSKPTHHAYTYFQTASHGKKTKKFAVLRLKQTNGHASVDLKARNDATGEWTHVESRVGNPRALTALFTALGLPSITTFRKTRRTFQNAFVRMDLDAIAGLGTFLEVKFCRKDQARAVELLKALGVNTTQPDLRSILEIYLTKKH